jgi:hypothetical protein
VGHHLEALAAVVDRTVHLQAGRVVMPVYERPIARGPGVLLPTSEDLAGATA